MNTPTGVKKGNDFLVSSSRGSSGRRHDATDSGLADLVDPRQLRGGFTTGLDIVNNIGLLRWGEARTPATDPPLRLRRASPALVSSRISRSNSVRLPTPARA